MVSPDQPDREAPTRLQVAHHWTPRAAGEEPSRQFPARSYRPDLRQPYYSVDARGEFRRDVCLPR